LGECEIEERFEQTEAERKEVELNLVRKGK
jgi:hypothetical protein